MATNNTRLVIETWQKKDGFFTPAAWLGTTLVALLAASVFVISKKTSSSSNNFPLMNPRKFYDIGGIRAKLSFVFGARKLLALGVRTGRPFRLLTDLGEMIVLPARYATEIRSDPRLSFAEVIVQNFHADFPGFEGFRQGTTDAHLSRDVANNQLTHSLARVTEALSEECTSALRDHFPASEGQHGKDNSSSGSVICFCMADSKLVLEWCDITLREQVLQLVARLSSRVFLGDEGARNEAWLKITTEYTKTAYIAAYLLRLWPPALRPIVHWVLPPCRKLRSQVTEARRILVGVIEARRAAKAAAKAEGRPDPEYNDAIAWFEQDVQERDSRYDPVVAQLILSQAAIETTTDLLTQTILDIAQNQEVVEPLRREITQVIREGGWKKSSLYDMKLVDSVLRESQRLKPLAMTSMHRLVLEDITLSDGVHLPKGSVIGVSGDRMWDAAVHSDPKKFDGYRFYRMRSSATNNSSTNNQAHLVSTSVDHLAFGHGKHACAGRFFVAHETKIALSHLLLKYDWKIAPSSAGTKPVEFGLVLAADPKARISIRGRKAEIEL